MDLDKVVELVSLALTFPTLVLCVWVCNEYGPASIVAVKQWREGEKPDQSRLLILGITVGFTGMFFDNLYWGIAWMSDFLDMDIRDTLFSYGSYSNVPFRQVAGIVSGTLHILFLLSYRRGALRVYKMMWLMTLFIAAALYWVHALGGLQ